jgi:hypothetical protein
MTVHAHVKSIPESLHVLARAYVDLSAGREDVTRRLVVAHKRRARRSAKLVRLPVHCELALRFDGKGSDTFVQGQVTARAGGSSERSPPCEPLFEPWPAAHFEVSFRMRTR